MRDGSLDYTLLQPVSMGPVRAGWAEREPVPEGARLSAREVSILRLVAGGYSNKEIGRSLHLSEGTVRNYLSAAIRKLDARNRADALRIAEEKGWL